MKRIAMYGNFTPNMVRSLQRLCPEDFEADHVEIGALSHLASADYMVTRGGTVDRAVMDAAPSLRLIQRWGVGYDKVDIEAAGARNIPVAICAGGNATPVAELTVALMLAVLRNIVPMAISLKRGTWAQEKFSARAYLLHGKTVGLIGIGNIARKVAEILHRGFDCTVLYYDVRRLSREEEETLRVAYAPLDALLRQSDVVSLHVPLLPSTSNMIDRDKLALMKPTACLINTSRGGVVQEEALVRALQDGVILGAGLDTFATEPLAADSQLLRMDNVVTTPHCAGNTVDNDSNMAATCLEIILRYDETGDQGLSAIVNRQFLPAFADSSPSF